MKVTLNIANDEELRIHVKELIAGQIKSIARQEVREMVKEILSKKIQDTDLPKAEHIFRDEISKSVKSQLEGGSWNSPSFVQKEARKLISKMVTDGLKNGI